MLLDKEEDLRTYLVMHDAGIGVSAKPMEIRIRTTGGMNWSAGNDLLLALADALKSNLMGARITTDWGHDLEFEVSFGPRKRPGSAPAEKPLPFRIECDGSGYRPSQKYP